MVVNAYSATANVFLQVSLSVLMSGKCIHMHSACVDMLPPSFNDSESKLKYGALKRASAGPTGSEESVMITS